MRKIFLLLIAFLLIFPTVLAKESKTLLKCEKKGKDWECVYEGVKCEITTNEIKCEIFETPFGSERKKVHIFGTEYEPGDQGRIFLQLLDSQQPVNNATCLIDLYYPDKTIWFDDAVMPYLEESDGLYYFDLILPEQTGIYMLTVRCFYIVDYTRDYADNFTLILGTVLAGDYTDTWKDDEQYHEIMETKVVGKNYIDVIYDFTNVSIPSNYTGIAIYWVGRWDDALENVRVWLWDFCNSTWYALPNQISSNTPIVTNFVAKEEYNVSCLVNGGRVRVRFNDTLGDGTRSNFWTDLLEVQMNYLTFGAIEMIRGGGELHVTNHTEYAIISSAERTWEEFFIRGTPPIMRSTEYYCKDNQTLIKNHTFEFCKDGVCKTYSKVEEIKCDWGCDPERKTCNYPPYLKYAIILGVVFIIFVVVKFIVLPVVRS